MKTYLIGIDIGSGSARAGLFNAQGEMLAHASRKITLFRDTGGIVEQSSEEIWQALCACVRQVVQESGIKPESVAGIGFDATCSLVVVGEGGKPLPVGPSENPERNIIVWMDHRATEEAEFINSGKHAMLKYVGGRISPEMETPKILWLKKHRRRIYDAAWQFFDLADYLTWRASGSLSRSACTVTCKWTYLAHEKRWDADYFRAIGLEELADEDFRRIGRHIADAGEACGQGLTAQAAAEMGLSENTPVAVGLIDAHAGGIGTVGISGGALNNLAYVFGTSSCTMTSTPNPVFVPGVWGPYFSAMVPGLWLNEGGQSAAGAAIDRLIAGHPAAAEAEQQAQQAGKPLPVYLADLTLQKTGSASRAIELAEGLHIVPEFLGNRAPFADPHARAAIVGLGMETGIESLIALYIAGISGIGYGLRQIIDAQAAEGIRTENIVISGGAGQHPLIRQLLADAAGLPVLTTQCPEPVLLGSAILGAVAGGLHASVEEAMTHFSRADKTLHPDPAAAEIHRRRYAAYSLLQTTAKKLRTCH